LATVSIVKYSTSLLQSATEKNININKQQYNSIANVLTGASG